ncbi:hypothetical protein key_105 [Erwinia phage KEY]|uniref:Uncharacterized protein n=1 Tax=Erwinia phage KEY TaxID=2821255 RepID=A0AAE8BE61_9CAUD|nr:hypothetical protein key_105 [Erwinia phage KEY]
MKISFTEKLMCNGILIITAWDGDLWCNVTGLKKEDQTPENISKVKNKMATTARLPGASRNGRRRIASKC